MTERHLDKSLEVEKGTNVFVPQRNRKKEVREKSSNAEVLTATEKRSYGH